MKGIVFDIQRFSLNDGPGIRTIVFLKGCMLDCLWCHNPESKSKKPQLKFLEDKCINCKKCGEICKNLVHEWTEDGRHVIHYDRCKICGKCINVCMNKSLSIIGKEMTAFEVVEELEKDKKYYDKSGGGITISGGEALYQPMFAIEIAKLSKEKNMHVVVETSGYGNYETFKELAKYVDLFYFDCKHTDNYLHKKYVGVSINNIEKNRNYLLANNIPVVLRCPLIPEYNFNQDHLSEIAKIYNRSKNILSVEILPYHSLGISKGKQIGIINKLLTISIPRKQQVEDSIKYLKKLGVGNVKKG